MEGFDDLLEGNAAYAEGFDAGGVGPTPAKNLAILTCMDSRIDVFAVLGLDIGDAKVVRNAGAQLNNGALHDLVLASHLLDVNRILIMPHTRCAMASGDAEALSARVSDVTGHHLREVMPRAIEDQQERLLSDVERLVAHPDLHEGTRVSGAIYDVDSGRLIPIQRN